MKKAILVIIVSLFLTSCSGSSESAAVTDSARVADSSITATDSTTAQIPADSASAK